MAVNKFLEKLNDYNIFVHTFSTHVNVKVVHKRTNFTLSVNQNSFEFCIKKILKILDL